MPNSENNNTPVSRRELEEVEKTRKAEAAFRSSCTLGGAIGGGPIGGAIGAAFAEVVIQTGAFKDKDKTS